MPVSVAKITVFMIAEWISVVHWWTDVNGQNPKCLEKILSQKAVVLMQICVSYSVFTFYRFEQIFLHPSVQNPWIWLSFWLWGMNDWRMNTVTEELTC